MRNSLLIGLLLFSVVFLASAAPVHKIPPDKAVLQFKAPIGNVAFTHEAHANKYGVSCEKCHHTLKPESAAPPQACSQCHKHTAQGKAPALKDAVHKKCWTCHKEEAAKGKQAPLQTKCAGCHKKG